MFRSDPISNALWVSLVVKLLAVHFVLLRCACQRWFCACVLYFPLVVITVINTFFQVILLSGSLQKILLKIRYLDVWWARAIRSIEIIISTCIGGVHWQIRKLIWKTEKQTTIKGSLDSQRTYYIFVGRRAFNCFNLFFCLSLLPSHKLRNLEMGFVQVRTHIAHA